MNALHQLLTMSVRGHQTRPDQQPNGNLTLQYTGATGCTLYAVEFSTVSGSVERIRAATKAVYLCELHQARFQLMVPEGLVAADMACPSNSLLFCFEGPQKGAEPCCSASANCSNGVSTHGPTLRMLMCSWSRAANFQLQHARPI